MRVEYAVKVLFPKRIFSVASPPGQKIFDKFACSKQFDAQISNRRYYQEGLYTLSPIMIIILPIEFSVLISKKQRNIKKNLSCENSPR